MEPEKRKQKRSNGRERGKAPEEVPGDDEVDEFFAILKRVKATVKYLQERDGGGRRRSAATPWNPEFVREDFQGAGNGSKRMAQKPNSGLDLNSHPGPDDDSEL